MKLEKKYSIKDMYCLSSKIRNQFITALFILIGLLHFIPEKSTFIHHDLSNPNSTSTCFFIVIYTVTLILLYFCIIAYNNFVDDEYEFEKYHVCYALGSITLLTITKYFNILGSVINYKSATYPILGFIMYYIILVFGIFLVQEFIVSSVLSFRKMQVTMYKRAFIPLTLEEMKAVDIKSMSDYEKVINNFLRYSCSMFGENSCYYVEPVSYIDLVKSGIALYEELNMFKPVYLNCKFNHLDGFSFKYEESYACEISCCDLENLFDTMYINK